MTDPEPDCPRCALTFETLIADPMTRAVMDSDGVQLDEMIALFERIWELRIGREAGATA
jgi:hypothetical protein